MTRHPVHKAPAADGRNVVLRDGSRVLIRPVRGTDALLIAEGFARLSEQSRRMRFLGKKDEIALTIADDWQGRGLGESSAFTWR